jgi:hypothetical protein
MIGHGLLPRLIFSLKQRGFTAIGIVLFFGAVMAGLAAITFLSPGALLDRVWVLNPIAYKRLAPLGDKVGILFVLLGVAVTMAGIGWFRRSLWGGCKIRLQFGTVKPGKLNEN